MEKKCITSGDGDSDPESRFREAQAESRNGDNAHAFFVNAIRTKQEQATFFYPKTSRLGQLQYTWANNELEFSYVFNNETYPKSQRRPKEDEETIRYTIVKPILIDVAEIVKDISNFTLQERASRAQPVQLEKPSGTLGFRLPTGECTSSLGLSANAA